MIRYGVSKIIRLFALGCIDARPESRDDAKVRYVGLG